MTEQPDLKARVEELADAVVNRIAPLAYTAGPNTRAAIRDALAPLQSCITDLEAERDEWKSRAAERDAETERRARKQWDAESRLALAEKVVEALRRSAEGWANAIELCIILPQHITAATILRDEAQAALTAYEENTSSKDLTTGEDDA